MTDREVYELLTNIDAGYSPSEAEKRQLSSVESVIWRGISQLPKSMSMLSRLMKLDLRGTGVSDISALTGMTSLTNLDLGHTGVSDISVLSGLTGLTNLGLGSTSVSDISVLSGLTGLRTLDLSRNNNLSEISTLSGLIGLTELDLEGSGVSDISALSGLTGLKNLDLSNNYSLSNISALSGLTGLKKLDLLDTRVSDISALIGLTGLTELDLGDTRVSDISALSGMMELTNLDLSRNHNLSDISALSGMMELTKLDLGGTRVSDISALSGMAGLTDLDLRGIRVSDISALASLTNLTKLDLRDLKISSIPEGMLDLELDFKFDEYPEGSGIYIYNLKLTDQPIEIFSQNRELIRAYYREQDRVPINECKVVFLGDSEAGKTLSIRRLLNRGKKLYEFENQSTPGIEITVDTMQLEDSDIIVNYWDFGGQEIQRSMHRMFMTERTIYVVFLNARQDPLDDRARYWLENINSFAKEAPVLLMINKIDQNDRPKFNEDGIRNDYGNQIKKIVRMSALEDEPGVFMNELQGSINEIIRELPTVSSKIPRSWKSLMEYIRTMPDYYLTTDQFKERCSAYSVRDYNIIHDDLVDLFQTIGISFCYYKNRALADYMLLNPKWLVNAIYTIISNSKAAAHNGVITQDNLYDLLKEDTLHGVPIRRVIPDLRYESYQVNYILGVIRMFHLSFPMKDGSEFFPMLCDGNEKISVDRIMSENALHYIFRYRYLPANVMHRLVVEMQRDLDEQYVWYSGAVFRNNYQEPTAYINTKGNDLHIYVDAIDPDHNLNEYLTTIQSIVREINSDMNLSAAEYVPYREGDMEVEIDADELKGNLESGNERAYNKKLKVKDDNKYDDADTYSASQIKSQINEFFEQDFSKYCRVDAFLNFLRENDTDGMRMFISEELYFLFQISESDKSIVPVHHDLELQQFLYHIWMIDTDRLKEMEIVPSKIEDTLQKFDQITKESNNMDQPHPDDDSESENQDQKSSVPKKPSDLEKATLIVLEDFQKWLEQDIKDIGYRIIQPAYWQTSGEQYGYDVGMEIQIGNAKYKLCFECKDYTSLIRSTGDNKNINIRAYAINLLKFYMNNRGTQVNNRWVLVNPFGNLQNDYPEKLFERWNEDHDDIKIFPVTENQSSPTCRELFSVNEEAFKLVYPEDTPPLVSENKKEDVFKTIKQTILGEDCIKKSMEDQLECYSFPIDFSQVQASALLSERTTKGVDALQEIMCCLEEIANHKDETVSKDIYIIGAYGTGKTWLLYRTIREIIYHPDCYPFVPVLMRLKEYSEFGNSEEEQEIREAAENYISSVFDSYKSLKKELSYRRKAPLFLLDGFDETLSGLSETNNKIKILLAIRDELVRLYGHLKPVFIITSRESDYHACHTNKEFIKLFEQFYKISLEDCPEGEVKGKLLAHAQSLNVGKESLERLAENKSILSLARRPIFFTLLTKIAGHEGSSLNRVVDEFSLLDEVVNTEIRRTIDEIIPDKNKEIIAKLRKSLQEELFNCALYCTQKNVNESIIEFDDGEISKKLPVGIVTVINKSVEVAEKNSPWTFSKKNKHEYRISFLHNIIREFLVAKKVFLLLESDEENEKQAFIGLLSNIQMSPVSLRFFMTWLKRSDQEEECKQRIKEWLNLKKGDPCLATKLMELVLQPDCTFGGTADSLLDLSGLHADNLCIWNCKLQHIIFQNATLRNMQMTDTELVDIDFRGADLTGLQIAPMQPIIDYCQWRKDEMWHITVLYQNGQVLQYSFTNCFVQGNYSVKLLNQAKGANGLFRIDETNYLVSEKAIYPIEEEDGNYGSLYQMRDGKLLHQIVQGERLNCIVTVLKKDYLVHVCQYDTLSSYKLGNKDIGRFCVTGDGYLMLVRDGWLKLVISTQDMVSLWELEKDYECFTIHQENNDEYHIYLKYTDKLIRLIYDRQFRNTPEITEFLFEDMISTVQEIHYIKKDTFAAISQSSIYILTIGDDKVHVEKVNTAVKISGVILEEADGTRRIEDYSAYELLSGSVMG